MTETTPTTASCGCPDYDEARLALSRRALLGTALAGGALALGPGLTRSGPQAYAVTGRTAAGLAPTTGSVLVLLSLRGAADGLSLVVPREGEDRPRPRPVPVGLPAAARRRPRLPRPPGVLT